MNIQILDRAEKSFRNPYNVYKYDGSNETVTLEGVGNGVSSVSESQFRRTMLYPLVSAKYTKKIGTHNLNVLVLTDQKKL